MDFECYNHRVLKCSNEALTIRFCEIVFYSLRLYFTPWNLFVVSPNYCELKFGINLRVVISIFIVDFFTATPWFFSLHWMVSLIRLGVPMWLCSFRTCQDFVSIYIFLLLGSHLFCFTHKHWGDLGFFPNSNGHYVEVITLLY